MELNSSSLIKKAITRLFTNKLSFLGTLYILLLVVLALFTPLVAPYDYAFQDLSLGPSGPSGKHWLGTD